MIKFIKNFFTKLFSINKELSYKEEQMLIREIYNKIRGNE